MAFFANCYGIIFGLAMGISIALILTMKFIKDSNDIGNSAGTFFDFGDYVKPINHEDELHNPYLYSGDYVQKNFFSSFMK